MTRILKRWDGNKSSSHPSAHEMTPAEVLALNLYSIEIRY